jgi:hypothetical protein
MPSDKIAFAGRALRRLAECSPTDPSELNDWNERAREFEQFLKMQPDLCNAIPHFVWHYLADADIRAREPQYRAGQQTKILRIASELETGTPP